MSEVLPAVLTAWLRLILGICWLPSDSYWACTFTKGDTIKSLQIFKKEKKNSLIFFLPIAVRKDYIFDIYITNQLGETTFSIESEAHPFRTLCFFLFGIKSQNTLLGS